MIDIPIALFYLVLIMFLLIPLWAILEGLKVHCECYLYRMRDELYDSIINSSLPHSVKRNFIDEITSIDEIIKDTPMSTYLDIKYGLTELGKSYATLKERIDIEKKLVYDYKS